MGPPVRTKGINGERTAFSMQPGCYYSEFQQYRARSRMIQSLLARALQCLLWERLVLTIQYQALFMIVMAQPDACGVGWPGVQVIGAADILQSVDCAGLPRGVVDLCGPHSSDAGGVRWRVAQADQAGA